MLNTQPVDTDGNLAAIEEHIQSVEDARDEYNESLDERIADKKEEIIETILADKEDESWLEDFWNAMNEDHPEVMMHLLTALMRAADSNAFRVIGDHAQAKCLPGIEMKARFLRNRLNDWAERTARTYEE